jgi:putative PIN family toxin of toxin-antitoxin system
LNLAVLDTQTLASGLIWHESPAHRVVNAALAGRFVPITSAELLAQLEDVVSAPEVAPIVGDPGRIRGLVERMSIVVEPVARPKVVAAARANALLAVAEAGAADYLVTSELSLLILGRHRDTRIVRAVGP